jgi:hypothetical protein
VQANGTADLKEGVGVGELWAGVLVGPTAMLIQLQTNYALVPWACGTGHTWPLHLVSLVALIVTVIPGFLAYRIWRRFARLHEDGGGVPARSRFMAAVGVLISLLMAAVILAQWLPVFIHHPCER